MDNYSVPDEQFEDQAKCSTNSNIMKQLANGEIVIFSCKVEKKKILFDSERTFLLTNFAMYKINSSRIQRRVPLEKVRALTKRNNPGKCDFIIHFEKEYDYMF